MKSFARIPMTPKPGPLTPCGAWPDATRAMHAQRLWRLIPLALALWTSPISASLALAFLVASATGLYFWAAWVWTWLAMCLLAILIGSIGLWRESR